MSSEPDLGAEVSVPDDDNEVAEDQQSTALECGDGMIDPRGPRFGASITTIVLAAALITLPSVTSVVLLVLQGLAFGAAALFGLRAQPYGRIYRALVQPRLSPPKELESEEPPRFAQQVGLAFVLIALVGLALGANIVATVAVACALAAAFLNAAFNFCLGCELYPLFRRLTSKAA